VAGTGGDEENARRWRSSGGDFQFHGNGREERRERGARVYNIDGTSGRREKE